MKLKQRVVLLAILLVIFIFTKVFLIDNLDTSAANREDQRAFHRMMAGLRVELSPKLDHTLQSPWEIAAQWVVPREVYPEETPELGAIMHAMATKKIIKADVGYKGTQLKALLILEGGQKVVFKPKRYNRDYVVEGEPYAGYDRHNAEVAAFHLDRFVNLRTEIKPVATEQLLSTFLTEITLVSMGSAITAERQSQPVLMETQWRDLCVASAETPTSLGQDLPRGQTGQKTSPYDSGPRLLDIIDTAVFDYLIGNADRHHYESFQDDEGSSMLILLDNAKRSMKLSRITFGFPIEFALALMLRRELVFSPNAFNFTFSFGNPSLDERSILAPLYQCCIIRVSTWNRLNYLKNGVLKSALKSAMAHDPISPVLSNPHLDAVDQRLLSVLATVKQCTDQFGMDTVLVEDRMPLSHL
ncbi:hypothetical protein MC885_004328 [Smutsia gigantea]|nr:hypothetical protein MC885_004328 [Smutsia gigantea]